MVWVCFFLIVFSVAIKAGENRLKAMGDLSWSLPDTEIHLNMYHFAGNNAWFNYDDILNWMHYNFSSENDRGDLKRYWDAQSNNMHKVGFSGQKHLDKKHTFYGEIWYNFDYRYDVQNAIEKRPYAPDPFVLADYTTGDIFYRGPEVRAVYSANISDNILWGASLHYFINRGLKQIETEPEIISREIEASIDFAWQLNSKTAVGVSFKPYHVQDITKLTTLSTGMEPVVRRYRGRFEYRERTGTSDRTAVYQGYEIRPQLNYITKNLEHVSYLFYFYQWHEIYDGTSRRYYDGYFQAQYFGIHTITRYLWGGRLNPVFFAEYKFSYAENWAKEARENLMFSLIYERLHYLAGGFSHNFYRSPWTIAFETNLVLNNPVENDYLANKKLHGNINDLRLKSGVEYKISGTLDLRAGYVFQRRHEDALWDYWGDFSGNGIMLGTGFVFRSYELETAVYYQNKNGTSTDHNSQKNRTELDFYFQLKQYF